MKVGKVALLTDEDRLTLVRWIDLGRPIDLDYDPKIPERGSHGWHSTTAADTHPGEPEGRRTALERILVGMHDYGSGVAGECFEVVADCAVAEARGREPAPVAPLGVYELKLARRSR